MLSLKPLPQDRNSLVLILLVAGACTAIVVSSAWVSDDALITFRYSFNLVHGHGPVFNLGERVQGYTHPLWFLLLTTGLAAYEEPLVVSIVLGSVLTFATVLLTLSALRQRTSRWLELGALLFGLLAASDSWRSFQTGGLENSLSHLLIALLAIMVWRPERPRPFTLSLTCALLGLTRPDLALLVAPLAWPAMLDAYRGRELPRLALGLLPLVAWGAFALLYYGELLPNTAGAKLGIYTTQEAVSQGLRYVWDLAAHEPLSATAICLLFGCAVALARSAYQRAFAAGILLYLAYVIFVGGDFMRGRFLLPVVVASSLSGLLAIAPLLSSVSFNKRLLAAGAALFIGAALLQNFAIRRDGVISADGIVNERAFYPGYHLQHYLREGRIDGPPLTYVDDLRAFVARCGPVTVHAVALGAAGYYSGPEVSVIDLIGLTDRYVAGLPRSSLVARPRPGHPSRRIPLSYLASRRDITLFSNWHDAVQAGDCGIIKATAAYETSDRTYSAGESTAALPVYTPASGGTR